MSFSGPSYRCPASLPRSASASNLFRGTTRASGSTRPIDGESPRGRPRRPSARDNSPVHSRQSINDAGTVSLNSPEAPPVNQSRNDDVPLLQIDAEPDDVRDSRLAAHSIGPVADLYRRYLHETDNGLSPSQRVSLLYGSLLQPSDIRDRGVNLQNPSPRFHPV
jgi:hypothetical protein